jgi:pilus assembly protein TadC
MFESITGSARYSARREAVALLERFIQATANDKKLAPLRADAQRFVVSQVDPTVRQRLTNLRSSMRYGSSFAVQIEELVEGADPEKLQAVIRTDMKLGPLIAEYLRLTQPASDTKPRTANRRTSKTRTITAQA